MNCWPPLSATPLTADPGRELNTATSASSFWRSRWSASPMKALTVSASAKYSVRWGWCTLLTIRRHRGGLRFRLPRMIARFASESSRAKCRMKMPACWAEWQDMPACSRPRKIWQHLLTFFCREDRRWFVRKLWRSSLAGKPRRLALPGHWDGTRLPRPLSQESISLPVHSAIWDTPARRCGSIPSASFPSPCSPTGPGLIAATKRSRTCVLRFTMRWWKRWRKKL